MSWYYLDLAFRTGGRERARGEFEDLGDAVRAALTLERALMATPSAEALRRPRHVDVVDESGNVFISIAVGYVRAAPG